MNIAFALLMLLILAGAGACYFSKEKTSQARGFLDRIKRMCSLSKKETFVLGLAVLFQIVTYAISQYVYKADILSTLRWQAAIGIMIPVAAIDLKKKIIPNFFILVGIGLALILLVISVVTDFEFILNIVGPALIGSAAAGGVFFIASLFVKGGIGAGDIKMFFMLGLLLAIKGVFNVLLYSIVISALVSVVLLISRKKKIKDVLPLAPFTAIGVALAIFFGV